MALVLAPTVQTMLLRGCSRSSLRGQPQLHRRDSLSVELARKIRVSCRPAGVARERLLFVVRMVGINRDGICCRHSLGCEPGGVSNAQLVSSDAEQHLPLCLVAVLSLCVGVSVFGSSPAAAAVSEMWTSQQSVGTTLFFGPDSPTFHVRGANVASPLGAAPMLAIASAAGVRECEETYGILPCSTGLGGNVFLMLVYGYLLLTAAKFISEGSELLLEVMNPGLLGGLLLPILGALPDSLLIAVSGAGGTIQEAQQEVMVGVGVLAGSTVMLLTIAWAGSLFAGRCDLSGPGGTAVDLTLSRTFDLSGTGVTTDEQTRWGAWIMMASVLPYLCAQIPLLDGQPAQGPGAALAGAVISFAGLLAYSAYQVASPWLQKKRIEEARLQFLRSRALQGVSSLRTTKLSFLSKSELMTPAREFVDELFLAFDKNKDGRMEAEELKGLIVGLDIQEQGSIPAEEQVETWLTEFDINADGTLSQHEFVSGMFKWAQDVSRAKQSRQFHELERAAGSMDATFWTAQSEEAKKVLDLLENEVTGVEEGSSAGAGVTDASAIARKAAVYMAAGAALAAVFADPMVDTIAGFSAASGVPPFFVAFVVTPFASNASELLSSIVFAMKKRKRNISLTFSQVYGAVTINNTLCLGLFLGIVYARGLTWDFSSEVTVLVVSILVSGALGGSRTTFPLWWFVPVLALYPLSIGAVALLDSALGWK